MCVDFLILFSEKTKENLREVISRGDEKLESTMEEILVLDFELLVEIESSLIAALVPVATFLRQITPEAIEYSEYNSYGEPVFKVGMRVFYVNSHTRELFEGNISHISSNDQLTITLLNGLIDKGVEPTQIKYTTDPLLGFKAMNDIVKKNLDEVDSVPKEKSNNYLCETGYLHMLLHTLTSTETLKRLSVKTNVHVLTDIKLLAGQMSWLMLSNLAHHALAPLGQETPMILQLVELRKLVRFRGPAKTPRSRRKTPDSGDRASLLENPTSSTEWMTSLDWVQYADWIDRSCEEVILYLSGGYHTYQFDRLEDFAMPLENIDDSTRVRKKR